MKALRPDYRGVVAANWRRTTGYLLAGREPCIRIRDDEVQNIDRVLFALHPESLAGLQPPASWVLGVLLCPGDSVQALVAWARRNRADGSRVWFFLHPATDPAVLAPWRDAGFRIDHADVVSSWKELHPLFGLALNDQVYADFKP